MTDFYKEFSTTSESEWIDILKSNLKENQSIHEILSHFHPIEEIQYNSYGFFNDKRNSQTPGQENFSRGGKTTDNNWTNNVLIPTYAPKEMNHFAHHFLMNGATGLKMDLTGFSIEECEIITQNIELEHITSTFYYSSKEQFNWIKTLIQHKNCVGTAINVGSKDFGQIPQLRNKIVKAIDVQYAGGNVTQEIAYALYNGHQTLFQLMRDGLSVDDAAAQIKFQFGIGGNFFFEVLKFKVFRSLWCTIIDAYQAKNSNSKIPYVEAETGFLNKSLHDPHTNLLRQTTEAFAAVMGGVDELTLRPYNAWSDDKNLYKTQRLALNIALLLKEESYLDKVIDPSGGAYIQEDLLHTIQEKAWEFFQKIEKKGIDFLASEIQKTANKRIERIKNKKDTLIGVNKYFNSAPTDVNWKLEITTPFGNPLILEKSAQTTVES